MTQGDPLANSAGGLSSFLNVRMETTCSQRGLPHQGDLGSDPRRVFSLADSESQFSHLQNADISLPGWIFFIHSFIQYLGRCQCAPITVLVAEDIGSEIVRVVTNELTQVKHSQQQTPNLSAC